jgi:hypothetical protein
VEDRSHIYFLLTPHNKGSTEYAPRNIKTLARSRDGFSAFCHGNRTGRAVHSRTDHAANNAFSGSTYCKSNQLYFAAAPASRIGGCDDSSLDRKLDLVRACDRTCRARTSGFRRAHHPAGYL